MRCDAMRMKLAPQIISSLRKCRFTFFLARGKEDFLLQSDNKICIYIYDPADRQEDSMEVKDVSIKVQIGRARWLWI